MNQIYNKAKEFQAMSSMRRSTHTVGPERRVEFLGHKKEWVGPRQDTHLDPRKVQLPKVWDQRLHVVETRRDLDASLALLEGLDPRLRPDDDLEGLDEL